MILPDKKQARNTVHTQLSGVQSSEFMASASLVRKHVAELLAQHKRDHGLRSVLTYVAQPKWREVDLSSIVFELGSTKFDYAPTRSLEPFPPFLYDVVLVPLYGFNDDRFRLGHGGGWYDNFLSMQPQALKVGVGIEACRVSFSLEPHDIPMDVIITENWHAP